MAVKVSSVAPNAGGDGRAANRGFGEGNLLRSAAIENEGIEAERRLLRRELILHVPASERDQGLGHGGSRARCPR